MQARVIPKGGNLVCLVQRCLDSLKLEPLWNQLGPVLVADGAIGPVDASADGQRTADTGTDAVLLGQPV